MEGDSLWARLIKSRWGLPWEVSTSGGSGRRVAKPSGWWGEVLKATADRVDECFFSQLRKEIGKGSDTLFWEESWVSNVALKFSFPDCITYLLINWLR